MLDEMDVFYARNQFLCTFLIYGFHMNICICTPKGIIPIWSNDVSDFFSVDTSGDGEAGG